MNEADPGSKTPSESTSRGKRTYPRVRVMVAGGLIFLVTVVRLFGDADAKVLAFGLAAGLVACIALPPWLPIRNALVGTSEIELNDAERRKLIFGLFILLAAWVAYLTLVNATRNGILAEHQAVLMDRSAAVHSYPPAVVEIKSELIHRMRTDWWALTIGQLMIFQVLLFVTYWLETCPKNRDFERPLQTIWCIICALTVLNVITIPGDAVMLQEVVANYPSK